MIKIGKVSYLNTLPIFYKWETSRIELIEGNPAELVIKLRRGEIQAGIVSSVEYLIHKEEYLVVPNICIASKERACSVTIFSKEPLEKIRSIYLTPSSLTSRELTLYILEKVYKNRPEILEDRDKAQALMLIGDEAIREKESGRWNYLYDLGQEWFKLHGLPFVFALFLVRRDSPSWLFEYITNQCKRSKEEFYKDLAWGKITVEGFDGEFLHHYFTQCLHYDLDADAWRSLDIFNGLLMKK